ncbi:MAG: hypothetical protein RIS79_1794 [Verrucomicrobiota bacterium]|jgi:hypothetical protein
MIFYLLMLVFSQKTWIHLSMKEDRESSIP